MRRSDFPACAAIAFLLCLAGTSHADESPPSERVRAPTHRFGVTPTWTHAFATSANHEGLGLAAEAFLGRRFAVALVGTLTSPFQEPVRPTAATRRNESLGSLFPEARVTLLRGERAELALGAGLGVRASRPISLVDPEVRSFAYRPEMMVTGGVLARVFLLRDVALSLEARHVTYLEGLENAVVQGADRRDEATWYGEKFVRNTVEARVGVTIFLSEK